MFRAEWELYLWGIGHRHSSSITNCLSCGHVLISLEVYFTIFITFQFRVTLHMGALDQQVNLGFKHVAGSIQCYLCF